MIRWRKSKICLVCQKSANFAGNKVRWELVLLISSAKDLLACQGHLLIGWSLWYRNTVDIFIDWAERLAYAQCGNLDILILANFKGSKTVILQIWWFWILIFWEFHTWKCEKYPQIQNSELFMWSKWQFLELQNDQNWFHVKFEWQKNLKIPHFSMHSVKITSFFNHSYFTWNQFLTVPFYFWFT